MIKHIILWNLKDSLSEHEKQTIKLSMKENLEALKGKIPGLLEIKVITNPLPSSNAEIMLYSTFESVESLDVYAVHKDHVHVANTYVRPFTASRKCIDFEL